VKVVIHDRTEEAPARLRGYAERKLTRLSRHFDRVLHAEVEFCNEHKRNEPARMVRILVHMDGRHGPLLKARETAPELQAALDLALDKLDRQVVRLKEKIKKKPRPASVRHAGDTALLMAATVRERIPERLRVRLRPESVEDAKQALEANGHVFRVFLDEDSGEINVAYRRGDGSVAVIEPVVS
jgi:putative sigma-54 modulation protein